MNNIDDTPTTDQNQISKKLPDKAKNQSLVEEHELSRDFKTTLLATNGDERLL